MIPTTNLAAKFSIKSLKVMEWARRIMKHVKTKLVKVVAKVLYSIGLSLVCRAILV